MANSIDQDKEANPIAEIFDEMFTLLQDLETRSVAVLEYVKEQGGATDEKLAPYLDRAAAASDVRWRAARARMEHLLAPKPKSSTDVAKDDKEKAKAGQSQEKGKEANAGASQSQSSKQQGTKPESKDLGKELGSAPSGTDKPPEKKDEKSQTAKAETDTKSKDNQQGTEKQAKGDTAKSTDAESQAAALPGGKKSDSQQADNAKDDAAKSGNDKPASRPSSEENQSQKASK